jgi:hypothetical protein
LPANVGNKPAESPDRVEVEPASVLADEP